MGGEGGNAEAGETVAESAFQNEVTDECRGPDRRDLQRRSAPAFVEHLARRQRCVALADDPVMLQSILDGVMQDVPLEVFNARAGIHLNGFVNVSAFPVSA